MHKAVALLSQHPLLEQIAKELGGLEKHTQERFEFLKKQMTDLEKAFDAKLNEQLKVVENYLREKNLLPENYNPEKSHLHLNSATGIVAVCDGNHSVPPVVKIFELLSK